MRKVLYYLLYPIVVILSFIYYLFKNLGLIPSILLIILLARPGVLGIYVILKILAPIVGGPIGVLY
jgi:hypothetical protein